MLRIGLTGGIACGKSEATECFEKIGVPVIDADKISRQITRRGCRELDTIVECFGDKVLDQDGNLNRPFMRRLIFNDASAKEKLNAILHPAIRRRIEKELELLDAPYCVIAAPLLLEANMQDMVDRIITIDCPIETQVRRITERDRCGEAEAMKIINSQSDRNKRLEVSDIVVNNIRGPEYLKKRINELHALLMRAAHEHGSKNTD